MAQPATRARRREELLLSTWPFCPARARDEAFGSRIVGCDATTAVGPMASMIPHGNEHEPEGADSITTQDPEALGGLGSSDAT